MTMLEELKPCPGCGSKSVRMIGGPGTAAGPQYWVGCDHCRWRAIGDTGAEAVALWNTRDTREIDRAKAEGWNAAVEAAAAEMAKRLIANTEVWSAEYWKGFDDARTVIQALKDKHDDA